MEAPLAFLTLFLGLTSGEQIVEFETTSAVAAIEIQLDAVTVSRLSSPPWRTQVDFGRELAPHQLSAVGFDELGGEIGRIRQLVNVQRPHAEIALLIDRDAQGRPVRARWAGSTVLRDLESPDVQMTLDGRRLAVDATGAATLPALDLEVPHVLSAIVRFGKATVARQDVVLGAEVNDEARGELSSTIFRPAPSKQPLDVARLSARVGGQVVPVVAADRGTATVFVVRPDRFSADATRTLQGGRTPRKTMLALDNVRIETTGSNPLRYEAMLASEDVTRFVWPYPTVATGASLRTQLFETSRAIAPSSGGFHWLLGSVTADGFTGPAHLTDAVAVAGTQAQASGDRTAVVLVLDESKEDPSQYTPAQARGYLARLRIPLFVWTIAPGKAVPLAAGWGPVVDINRAASLRRAVKELRDELESQRVVWIEGTEIPDRIEVTEGEAKIPESGIRPNP